LRHPSVADACRLGDRQRLAQVLTNLLVNAVKFTEHGRIDVTVETRGREALLTVRDTGRGIDAAFRPKVFDPFAQADQSTTRLEGGLGLGLAIVRHVVEQHEGTVSVTSEGLGKGAAFTVSLPIAGSG
jgi:signal transduction histidine kinase